MLHLLLLAPLALSAPQDDAPLDAPTPSVAAVPAPRAFLGVQISLAEGLGLRVDRVVEESAAEAAGLGVGDVLAAFNGVDLDDPEQLQKLIGEAGVGAEVRLTVLREDAVEHLNATLEGLEDTMPEEGVLIEELIDSAPLLDQLREVSGDAPQIIQLQGDLEELRGQLRELRAPVEIATLAPLADDRPFLGVYLGSEEGPGVRLEGTVEGSGAANAGVQQGDRLRSVGGSLVDDTDSLRAILERYSVGDTVEVTVERGDQSLDLLVELGGRPVELEESLEEEWVFEEFDLGELEAFDIEDLMGIEEFEFDMNELRELEELEFEYEFEEDEWVDWEGDESFGRNHFQRDREDGFGGGDRMPDWARELRHEMNQWRREMERDMQSLRREFGGRGGWNVRVPEAPQRMLFRGGSPGRWSGPFSPDGGGIRRFLEIEELPRHLPGQRGESHAERHEVHVDSDGQRVERRFRGVRNGDGWDWMPMDGGEHGEIEDEIGRVVERALRVRPEIRGNGQEIEVEVHVEHEHDGREQHGHEQHGHGGVDGEIEALKRRLDELEAQRAELRERLKELKQRR